MMRIVIIVMMLSLLIACSHNNDRANKQTEFRVLKPHKLTSNLFYFGTIQPLKTVIVTTPADGVVSDVVFHYGDKVASKQPLLAISSDKFFSDYKKALMDYIKAKTDFSNQETVLKESEFLHKNLLISDDDYKSKRASFFNTQLVLMQAKDALTIYLKQMNLQDMDLFSLSIENVDKINQVLHAQNDTQILNVVSPAAGVVLLPIKNDSSDSKIKKLVEGDGVKQGDMLVMIGDVSGLTIHINVNEFNVNQLKVGQKVKVTGNAFSEFELRGEISSIDRQAQISQGSMPVFPVEIIVPKLSEREQKMIHIGMSAKVEIEVTGSEVLTVPIAAVFEKNGSPYVRVMRNNKLQDVFVQTGQTTQDEVVILSNLKAGDNVVIAS